MFNKIAAYFAAKRLTKEVKIREKVLAEVCDEYKHIFESGAYSELSTMISPKLIEITLLAKEWWKKHEPMFEKAGGRLNKLSKDLWEETDDT